MHIHTYIHAPHITHSCAHIYAYLPITYFYIRAYANSVSYTLVHSRYTHMHIYTHTYTHLHTHRHTHIFPTQAYTHISMSTHVKTTYTHTYTYTEIHKHS
jgi:hypothetical protein